MVVTNETNRTSVVGTGAEQIITFSFPIVNNSDITVYKRLISTGAQETLTETTNYTVTNNGSAGGSITTVTPFFASTYQIHIVRNTPVTQSLDLEQGGSFNAEFVEAAFDKATKLITENKDSVDRVLRFPATDPTTSLGELPNSKDRAGKVLSFDSTSGAPTASSAVPTGSVTISAFAETFLDDANALTTMATIQGMSVINVKNATYGAAGDGVTDDKTAFESAISATSSDGILYIPEGTFLLSSSVTINKSLRIIGNGKGSVIKVGFAGFAFTVTAGTNLILENFFIDGNSTGTGFSITAALELLRVDRVTFQDAATDYCISASSARDIDRVEIVGCTLKDCLNGIKLAGECISAYIAHNLVDTLTGTGGVDGFLLGTNVFAVQDAMQRYVVVNNIFLSITTTGVDSESHAIRVYGREAIIRNNIIDTVTNGGGSTAGAEAIYTKARFTTITGNVIVDGGRSNNGVIALKGVSRGIVTAPQGFSTIIAGNILLESSVQTDIGIYIATDDVVIENNYCEGLSGSAIRSAGMEIDNIVIRNNKIIKHKGIRGIRISHRGKGLKINGNLIDELLLTEAGIGVTVAIGIQIQSQVGSLTDVQINNNYIYENLTAPDTADIFGIVIDSQDSDGRFQGLELVGNHFTLVSTTKDVTGIFIDITSADNVAVTRFVVHGNNFTGLSGQDSSGTMPLTYAGASEIKMQTLVFNNPGLDSDIDVSYENAQVFYEGAKVMLGKV